MTFELKKTDVYTLKGHDNEKESKPIKVYYRFLNRTERQQYFGWNPMVMTGGDITRVCNDEKEDAVKVMVSRIENLEIKKGKEKTTIDDAEKLYSTEGVPSWIIDEIEVALSHAVAEVNPVPLESPSPSTANKATTGEVIQ